MITRRRSVKLALGSMAATALGAEPEAGPVATRIVDTHVHLFDPTRPQGVLWPTKDSPLYHPAYPQDWAAVANKLGAREMVVIEASPWPEDNDWMLNLAAREKSILGFIGHLLPGSSDFAKEVKRLAANSVFRGVRVGGEELRNNIGTTDFARGAKLLADMDLVLELNGLDDLAQVAKFSAKVPGLRIVLEHAGSPGNPQALRPGWKEGIATLAKTRNVFCKVSALVEFGRPPDVKPPADPASYLPVLNHVWATFGDDRLMFGSDWPVSELTTPYKVQFKIVSDFFKSKSNEACEKFFWKNALAAYKWSERK